MGKQELETIKKGRVFRSKSSRIFYICIVALPTLQFLTYAEYTYYYRANITPTFEGKEIEEIDSFFLQQYINSFTSQRHFRTAVKIYNLLMPCFKYAVANGVIPRNPMDKIVLQKYYKIGGMTLTLVEDRHLL